MNLNVRFFVFVTSYLIEIQHRNVNVL